MTDDSRNILRQYVTLAGASILMTLTTVVDQTMAAMLGSGATASLNYAAKVIAFGTGSASVAVGTAVMPYFSKMVAGERWAELNDSLASIVRMIFFATIPIAAALYLFSTPIIR